MKKFKVTATWFDDAYVIIEVNPDVLTPELATLINEFWSDSDSRLADEDDDVVKAVIRLFGATAIGWFMENGGADCNCKDDYWTNRVLEYSEGWPKTVDTLGMRLKTVSVNVPSFDDCDLEEL